MSRTATAVRVISASPDRVFAGGRAREPERREWSRRTDLRAQPQFLPPVTDDIALDLIETRTFGSRVIYERYGRARDESD